MEKKFRISITRTSRETVDFDVAVDGTGNDAADLGFAKMKALEMAANHEFGSGQAEYSIEASREL